MDKHIVKYIEFYNNTDLPVMIDSWIDGSNILYSQKIEPYEKKQIHSSVGEWHLHTMFPNIKDYLIWKSKGLENYNTIGKFRSQACAQNKYSWLEHDLFICTYTEDIDITENKPKKSELELLKSL
jgi:hypothetical protein